MIEVQVCRHPEAVDRGIVVTDRGEVVSVHQHHYPTLREAREAAEGLYPGAPVVTVNGTEGTP